MKKLFVLLLGLVLSIGLIGCANDPLVNEAKDYYVTGNFNGWDTIADTGLMVAIAKNDDRIASIKDQLDDVEFLYLKEITLPTDDAGWTVTYKINEKFSFQSEILLATKGSFINTIGDIEQANIFVYIEMPLLAKMKFLPEAKINPFIFCGPALSLNALAMNSVGVLDSINGFDLGLIIGSGLSYRRISFDIRYDRGLIDFDNSADDIDLKNQTISFLLGIAFYASGGN